RRPLDPSPAGGRRQEQRRPDGDQVGLPEARRDLRRGELMSAPPLLEMRDISKTFPGVRALDRVSFDLRRGEIHALVGENGAGKSTLMKVLAAVYPTGTHGGEIEVDGHPQHFAGIRDAEKAGIAVVHQELSLVSEMT